MASQATSICTTCDNLLTCNWSQNEGKMFCSEYYQALVEDDVKPVNSISPYKQIVGLCGSCEHNNNCQWNIGSQVIFECEHYE